MTALSSSFWVSPYLKLHTRQPTHIQTLPGALSYNIVYTRVCLIKCHLSEAFSPRDGMVRGKCYMAVCPSVYSSVTNQSSIKQTKFIITQPTPHDTL